MLESWGCGLYTSAAYTRVFTVTRKKLSAQVQNMQIQTKNETNSSIGSLPEQGFTLTKGENSELQPCNLFTVVI